MLHHGSIVRAVFREVRRDISLGFDFATTDKLRTALSLGCRALHFSGHGHPGCLIFEVCGYFVLSTYEMVAIKRVPRLGWPKRTSERERRSAQESAAGGRTLP